MDILFLSPADWDGVRGRFQHIAAELARHNRVLYVDGIGIRPITLAWRDVGRVLRRLARLVGRGGAKRPSVAATMDHVGPFALPFARSAWIGRVNRFLLLRYLRRQLRKRTFVDPLIWIAYPHPDLVPLLGRLSAGSIIYDCVDAWSEFADVHADFAPSELALFRAADLVLATSPALQARAAQHNPRSFLVANGVDFASFAAILSGDAAPPADIADIPRPRIGFVGNIAPWVDVSLIETLAKHNSAWQLVLVGPWQCTRTPPRLANLHWLGRKSYGDIPRYISAFDVAIIAFHVDDLTRSVDPLKLYEYLAVGRPVVATPLPAVSTDLAALVGWAKTPTEFEAAVSAALSGGETGSEKRRAAAARHSWHERMKSIAALAKRHLGLALMPEIADAD